LHEDVKRIS